MHSFGQVHSLADLAEMLLNILSKCGNVPNVQSYDEEEIQPRRAEDIPYKTHTKNRTHKDATSSASETFSGISARPGPDGGDGGT
jgi:hypothetical protein